MGICYDPAQAEVDRLNRQHLDALNATIIKQANTIGLLIESLKEVCYCLNWHANVMKNGVGMDDYHLSEARKLIESITNPKG